MRRSSGVIASLILAMLLALPAWAQQAVIPAFDSPVVDTTETLDAASRQQLEQQALDVQQRTGSQLQVLMVPTTAPEAIEPYAVRAFEQFKLGRKGVDDGVLLVVAKDDRKVRIEVGYGLEGAIPDITAGRVIQEYLAPKFRQGDYAGGIRDATSQLVKLIEGEPLPEPVASHPTGPDSGEHWLYTLAWAFGIGMVARGLFGRMSAGVRGLMVGAACGALAWWLSSSLLVGFVGALIGLMIGVDKGGSGRFASHGNSGGFGGGGGGGWSGGGGSTGGGGASGSW